METNAIHRKILWNDLPFSVVGLIHFIMINDHTFLDKENLRTLVDETDRAHPWSSFFENTDPTAVRIVETGYAKMHEPGETKGREYTITIEETDRMNPDQFYAYSRYLDCLAEKLAAKDIGGVHTVKIRMEITGCITEYITPSAQKHFEKIVKKIEMLKFLSSNPL
ncbi:MAG: hypothetical protein AAB628_01465 [Patescibacteria group bacterium]